MHLSPRRPLQLSTCTAHDGHGQENKYEPNYNTLLHADNLCGRLMANVTDELYQRLLPMSAAAT